MKKFSVWFSFNLLNLFQLCDIKVSEIESMVARLPRIAPGSICHERLGWLPPGFAEQCRDIINNIVIEQLKREQNDCKFWNFTKIFCLLL